ncbi:MutS-related protein [Tenacibaculum sp. M341]|uniref:MutS-related protein n=1 Tax=Tenacibaculum sp. M341 TaxID=2530339 RepID=UPI00104662DA|nr:DNA mismatch repair protein MutS [Tenacibaculum sp. M341]TCI85909.1 DNA mismatch repair protein MutS [Tenacibaculum sp. M341]
MHPSKAFYSEELKKRIAELNELKKKLTTNSILRFASFITTALGIYFTFQNIWMAAAIFIIGIAVFIFFVVKHTNLQFKSNLTSEKIKINEIEIAALDRKFHQLDEGNEFKDGTHFFSNDIDLFGYGSFFQYINRTTTKDGKQKLADNLTSNVISEIEKKQKGLKELSTKVLWRQHFAAISSIFTNKVDSKSILKWILSYEVKLPSFLKILTKVFSLITITLFVLTILNITSFTFLTVWFFVGMGITGRYLKDIQNLYTKAGKAKEIFKQYSELLMNIEEVDFKSEILTEKQKNITFNNQKASSIFKQFSKILDAFDQRNNIIFAVFGNGLFLWDIQNATKTENWIHLYKNTVKEWFETVSFFDAHNSLANFVYNHPTYVFPELTPSENIILAENLGHPLLDPTKRVDNDFNILNEEFFIVTGANMAGKSTFLRTVSLSIVMANCGLPVCASSFTYQPIKLITSMRTSDSLNDDESYFYSELKRLKFIVDATQKENYFIILDEILKGTNSKDKAIGSKRFVEKLNKSKSTGIIATHDVSLCDLADEYSTIKNYYFDAEIVDNELYFDYSMKDGVCKNMNASFLLQRMEIV